MIDRALDTWPARWLVLALCWLEDRRTYGYVRDS